ncbi:MAG: hypothetical protein H7123_02135 [Thermoleophilia bacterium]|nr:hypothetical protein [Thermoleophilia bacterium]
MRNNLRSMWETQLSVAVAVMSLALAIAGCGGGGSDRTKVTTTSSSEQKLKTGASPVPFDEDAQHTSALASLNANRLPGMPEVTEMTDIYAADRPNQLSAVARLARPLIYVPNSESDTLDVIDPKTYKIVAHAAVGQLPQHIVPSYDLRKLWITNDASNSLTAIDPKTGKLGKTVPVDDPYNMYFTPDGKHAMVVAERLQRLDFRDAQTMKLQHSLTVPCSGIDHVDFTADGRTMLASCEFSGKMAVVDVAKQKLVGMIRLPGAGNIGLPRTQGSKPAPGEPRMRRVGTPGYGRSGVGMPQDVKLSPDGLTFYVADMVANGIYVIDAKTYRVRGLLPTGKGAHGLYVSRDSRYLYVTNRLGGSVSLVDFASERIAKTWRIANGSPDMGGVSADGKTLWLSGRYNAEVYAIDTTSGKLLARIKVGNGPHGLCVFPQPGRYSLGHTGVFR